MTSITQRVFRGELPRYPGTLLPENSATYALNCDFQHGELRPLRGLSVLQSGLLVNGKAVRSVYTEDGSSFYAWSQEVDAVRSQVNEDTHYRLYYTILYDDGPVIKVARTHRNSGGSVTKVIGTSAVGGNYQAPENSSPGAGFGNSGPDAWVLGVPPADPESVRSTMKDPGRLSAELVDRTTWPQISLLGLRVIFFLEDSAGNIVAQVDISNSEEAASNVYYSADDSNEGRGHKVQDMLWPLGYTPRPFKYYWFNPPTFDDTPIARIVTVENSTGGNIVITYGDSAPVGDGFDNPFNRPIDQA